MQRKITLSFAVSILCLFSTQAIAQDHKIESWYLYFALGYANLTYPDEVQGGIDQLKDLPNVSHASLDVDLLGIYWPLRNQRTLLGLNLNERSEAGLGLTIGGGYSFPVSSGTRIVLNANFSSKRIEGERFGKFNISIGGLF